MLRATFDVRPAGSAGVFAVRRGEIVVKPPLGLFRSAPPAVAAPGGGLAADNVRSRVEEAGGGGLLFLLGWRAYAEPGGLEAAVARAVASVHP